MWTVTLRQEILDNSNKMVKELTCTSWEVGKKDVQMYVLKASTGTYHINRNNILSIVSKAPDDKTHY